MTSKRLQMDSLSLHHLCQTLRKGPSYLMMRCAPPMGLSWLWPYVSVSEAGSLGSFIVHALAEGVGAGHDNYASHHAVMLGVPFCRTYASMTCCSRSAGCLIHVC